MFKKKAKSTSEKLFFWCVIAIVYAMAKSGSVVTIDSVLIFAIFYYAISFALEHLRK